MDAYRWCEERVLMPGSRLSVSVLFVPESDRRRIVAIWALIGEIGRLAELSDEPHVQSARLQWWMTALGGDHGHPAIEALRESGAYEAVPVESWHHLLAVVEGLGSSQRFETVDQAWSFCESVGGMALELEVRALGGSPNANELSALHDLGGASYWMRWIRDLAFDARAGRWYVPLELQAKFQLSRRDLMGETPPSGWVGLIRGLIHEGLDRSRWAFDQMSQDGSSHVHHALISAALDRRLASHMATRPSKLWNKRLQPSHVGNVWCAWRQARQLARRK